MTAVRQTRLRPAEWVLTFFGLCTAAALATFFFRALPGDPSLLSDGMATGLLRNRVFQVGVLGACWLVLAAGLAERVGRASERATTMLAIANVIAFACALLVYYSLAR